MQLCSPWLGITVRGWAKPRRRRLECGLRLKLLLKYGDSVKKNLQYIWLDVWYNGGLKGLSDNIEDCETLRSTILDEKRTSNYCSITLKSMIISFKEWIS